ncbi:telomeric repeat-binding factor 1 isoform X2 [Protopterus annectens]|uniref:telomeric repeat-binding factor 1 isoform X2 n=1 Tax=Protopterus annectens TaxID=7888 RepID=UPI001CFC26C5|nr:telomeric repeat-binding factor 1 isoform X2 [Protopterus annectens]
MLSHRAAVEHITELWKRKESADCNERLEAGDNSLSNIVALASDWMMEFLFYCMCHYFKEGDYKEFKRLRDAMEGMIHLPASIETTHLKSVRICQFLSRIVEGKNLDCQFETDKKITPLESALLVWSLLEKEQNVKNEALFEEIKLLLQVQAVGVCMEKGQLKMAEEVLERELDDGQHQSLKSRLSQIINKKDPYHQFLQNFSYSRMLERIRSFIELVLPEQSSGFLLKSATKVVQANNLQIEEQKMAENKENCTADQDEEEEGQVADSSTAVGEDSIPGRPSTRRTPKSFFSFHCKPWRSHYKRSCKRSALKKLTLNRQNQKGNDEQQEHVKIKKILMPQNRETTRRRRLWSWQEDRELKAGVKRFGVGNWIKILEYYEFDNRTHVNLKDRWRTLTKKETDGE